MNIQSENYNAWFELIKLKIKSAQLRTSVAINKELLELYWDLGKAIVIKQQEGGWGDGILEQLSIDLKLSFPSINGFSKRNLYAIRQWFLFYSVHSEFVPPAVAQIPWGHNRLIISKIKDLKEDVDIFCEKVQSFEVKIESIHIRTASTESKWSNIIEFFVKIFWVIIVSYLLYKLGIQGPPA